MLCLCRFTVDQLAAIEQARKEAETKNEARDPKGCYLSFLFFHIVYIVAICSFVSLPTVKGTYGSICRACQKVRIVVAIQCYVM
jgi:hypothetical protein